MISGASLGAGVVLILYCFARFSAYSWVVEMLDARMPLLRWRGSACRVRVYAGRQANKQVSLVQDALDIAGVALCWIGESAVPVLVFLWRMRCGVQNHTTTW